MRALFVLLAVALLVLVGASAADSALVQAGDEQTVTNETWSPNAGSVTTLDESNRNDAYYDDTVDVWDENGTAMDSEQDYVWYRTNGTIKTVEGGRLAGDSDANITYGYAVTSEVQRDFASVFAGGFDVAGIMVFVLGIGLTITAISFLGDL